MTELFSRMFRVASPTKASSDGRSHPNQQSHARNLSVRPDSRSQRRSEDARPSITLSAPSSPSAQVVRKEAAAEPESRDWRPPISPPGRLRSTSHPSLSSSRSGTTTTAATSARRKAAPAPLDLSLSRLRGTGRLQTNGPAQPGAGVSEVRAAQDSAAITARQRPATSHGMHARSQSQHLPALSAFGMDHPPRPSSAMDTAMLPPSLRGQYLLDTHKSIELDRPVYTPIDRPSFDVAGTWSEGPYERPASAAAGIGLGAGMRTTAADVPVSAAQVSATAAVLAHPGSDAYAERTPRRKTSTSDFTSSLSRSAKSPKSLSKSLSKKPSILRTLAHHPSLSALRKKKKDKEQARLQEEERYVETPDLVGDVDGVSVDWTSREYTTTPTPGMQEGQAKSLWGSVKRKSKRGREKKEKEKEKGLRGVKSVPGLRMSSESTGMPAAPASLGHVPLLM